MNIILKTLGAVVVVPVALSLSMTGCAGSKTASNTAASAVSPVAALAAKVGIPETLVNAALQAAQAVLMQKSQPAAAVPGAPPAGPAPAITTDDKAAAAQQGVDAAAGQAQAEGKPLPDAKKYELLQGLKSLL